jgi:hypothetical protein
MSDQGTVFGWLFLYGIAAPICFLVWAAALTFIFENTVATWKKIKRGF